MKKILCTVSAILLALSAMAVPAKPGVVITFTQPDGTQVRVQLHGDEYLNWYTLAGTNEMVARHDDGFWRPTSISAELRAAAKERRRQDEADMATRRAKMKGTNARTHGEHHIPVLLVEFTDVKFKQSDPKQAFNDMLNKRGYNTGDAKGSVRDYFSDNSFDEYKPVFDVYGPVTLPHNMAYYGEQIMNGDRVVTHDKQAYMALIDGANILDATVNFAQYDEDHDGMVDMTLFYYAGYSQAEGGPTDAIWPHQSSVRSRNAVHDGVKLGNYFCTAELRGSSGNKICGIGVTAHEFSHSLGLPDYYDTDYEDNGESHGMGSFSVMDSGCYLKGSDIPPYFNALERTQLDWADENDITVLSRGYHTMQGVQHNEGYMLHSPVEGEGFMLEYRNKQGWDQELPAGLVIYHIDKSTAHHVTSYYTAYSLWDMNDINVYGHHPCCYVIPAADQTSLNTSSNRNSWVFPGTQNVKSYKPIDWDGNELGEITDIAFASDNQLSFKAKVTGEAGETPFGRLGMTAIYDPGNGVYDAGSDLELQLDMPDDADPVSVAWTFDKYLSNGIVKNLQAGKHLIRAVVKWPDGSTEYFELEITVQ